MAVVLLSLEGLADVAVILTGLGVLVLLYQVRQARLDSEVELVTGMTTMMLEVDKALIDYPEMRPYFTDRMAPPDSGPVHDQAHAIGTAMANALDHVVAHIGLMKRDTQWAWEQYIADLYEQSPVFADLLDHHPEWWPYLRCLVREWRISGRLGSCPKRRPAAVQSA